MNGFGFSGESNSLPYGDFMDNLVKFLDFPLENVEDEIGDCDVETEGLEAFPTEAVLGSCSNIGSDCPNSKSEIPKTLSVSVEETCQLLQPANFPQGISTRNIPLQNSLSNADTLNPSAEETKPFSSSFMHPSSENQCPLSSSSTALDESCPSDASESLPKATSSTEFDPSKEILNSRRTTRKKRKQKRLSELYMPLESKRTSPRRPIATESEEVKKNRLPLKTELKKCNHCKSTRTPQWRAGPLGPKTLCNACGVRYRSGRLLPEYRPAASPTFVKSLHSNCHRIVMGMRKGNELPDEGIEDIAMSPSPEFVPMCSYLFD